MKPSIHVRGKLLAEEDLILCKTDKDDTSWYLAEVTKIFPDEIEVAYYTTPKPLMEGYATATLHQNRRPLEGQIPQNLVRLRRQERW